MIKCARIECKYRSERTGSCQCKKVVLSAWNVATMNMGRKDFLECKSFEESDKSKELREKLIELGVLKRGENNEK